MVFSIVLSIVLQQPLKLLSCQSFVAFRPENKCCRLPQLFDAGGHKRKFLPAF
ncbi:hypothetical protein EVA_06849 [gut metagenome]|uniref:Uncharacterized protein n=1 Tax=gut metagenome TaxID=749906 RepID=J9GDU4_9ZZZZ